MQSPTKRGLKRTGIAYTALNYDALRLVRLTAYFGVKAGVTVKNSWLLTSMPDATVGPVLMLYTVILRLSLCWEYAAKLLAIVSFLKRSSAKIM